MFESALTYGTASYEYAVGSPTTRLQGVGPGLMFEQSGRVDYVPAP